ncbi:MAG TPA: hypothetical protein VLS89_17455 [Candidatus Nanopelagicales bacterium]|nr:hypothetical protein [Candidatus Nanopelagicales bacterium]
MAIRPAHQISWTPPPRCPVCGVGIAPSGRREPFVVDDADRVYCREHGGAVVSGYQALLDAYREEIRRARDEVSRYLAEDGAPPSPEEIAAIEAEWAR